MSETTIKFFKSEDDAIKFIKNFGRNWTAVKDDASGKWFVLTKDGQPVSEFKPTKFFTNGHWTGD